MKKGNKFNLGIRGKLITAVVLLTMILLLLVNSIIYFKVVDQSKEEYIASTEGQVNQLDIGVNNYVFSIKEATKLIAESDIVKLMDSRVTSYVDKKGANGVVEMTPLKSNAYEVSLYKYFQYFVKNYTLFNAASVAVEQNGGFLKYPVKERKNGYDPRPRDWYKQGIKNNGKVTLTDVHVTSNGEMLMSSLVSVKDSNNIVRGVVSLDFNPKILSDIVEKVKIGNNGYIILTDKNGTILANPKDKSSISKNIKELNIQGLDLSGNGKNAVNIKLPDGKTYLINSKNSLNDELGWKYVYFIEKNDFMKSASKIQSINIGLFIIFTLIGIVSALIIARTITKPIVDVSKHISKIGEGDFTQDLNPKSLKLKDEIGVMANATKNMQDSIKGILLNVKENSFSIKDMSEELYSSVEKISSASTEVSESSHEAATGTTNQANKLQDIVNIFESFGEEIEITIKYLKEIDENTKNIDNVAHKSNSELMLLNESIDNTKTNFKEFSFKILELDNNMKKINDIIVLINNIADQTNLLALNAAIEAARAGETGKGFAVVADEIRKLAEKSKLASQDINKILNNISNDTGNIVKGSEEVNNEFVEQAKVIGNSIDTFKQIVNAIQEVGPKIESINNSAAVIEERKNSILTKIEDVSVIAQEISASSEEISTSSQNVSVSLDEIASAAHNLNDNASKMMDKVDVFKI